MSGGEIGTDVLTVCDRAPLHNLGQVQPFGRLLVLSPDCDRVVGYSANAAAELDDSAARARWAQRLREILPEPLPAQAIDSLPTFVEFGDRPWQLVAHRAPDGFVIVELEPVADTPVNEQALYLRGLERIRELALTNDKDLLLARGREAIAQLAGFDRTMIYRFHEDGHGEVIGETLAHPDWESFLGLHYPATDIPRQARQLYLQNRIRIIADADAAPSPVVGLDSPPNLSGSHLRSVSPIHIQYLQNMGVRASASLSLVVDGELWGLVACHHATPRALSAVERSNLDLVARALSDGIARCSHIHFAAQFKERIGELNRIVHRAIRTEDSSFFVEGSQSVANIIACEASILIEDGKVSRTNLEHLDAERLVALVRQVDLNPSDVFATSASAPFLEYTGLPGVMIIPLSADAEDCIVLLRQEVERELHWAGRESVERRGLAPDDPRRLEPRGSFELFTESVRGSSRPWTELERELATHLRNLYLELWVGFLRRKNEQLARRNSELAHILKSSSHDLKGALRVINYNMAFLSEAFESGVEPQDRQLIDKASEAADKIGTLLEGFLEMSVSNAKAVLQPFSPVTVIAGVLGELRAQWPTAAFDVEALPDEIVFSPTHFTQIASNLMSNALKYAGGSRMGVRYLPNPGVRWHVFQFWDEGPGIAAEAERAVFEPFTRLTSDGEGAGLGLDLVRNILGFHGGEVALRANGERGALFEVKIPKLSRQQAPRR